MLPAPSPEPSPIAAWLGSLSPGYSVNEKRLPVPSHQRQPSDTSEPTGLVQRCVIVQKDEHGFGFTVSGDRIVLVQSVKPGGAAMRAGLQEGDRIIKVNGTLVTNSSHIEVVKLIKSGAYVALTLLGPPPSTTSLPLQQDPSTGSTKNSQANPSSPLPPSPMALPYSSSRITEPRPLQDPGMHKHATQILKNMLKQEEAELQRMEGDRHRDPSLEERIEGAKKRVSLLQFKIRQEAAASMDSFRSQSESSAIFPRGSEVHASLDSQDGDSGLDSGTERTFSLSEGSMNRHSLLSDGGSDSPWMLDHHRTESDTLFSFPTDQGSSREIIGPEEEEYDADNFEEADGSFQDLESLKLRPAHMAVFLRFLFSQADPCPLLFYLCADVCHQSAPKDARNLGKEIWSTFLDTSAPLKIKIPENLTTEIEASLRSPEEVRLIFAEAQECVLPEIQHQIQDYRSKRMMGLGNLYGENNLTNLDGDGSQERQLAEKLINQLREILTKYEEERSGPMAFAMNTYMRHVGLKVREMRPSSFMEKTEKDKWLPFFPKPKKQSGAKKEKERDNLDDKKRNPILKYIGKPKGGSQSTFHVPLSPPPSEVKPGNVRTIIQHFENNHYPELVESGQQRLSTGSIPEDLLDSDSGIKIEVKLGRSESLKGREELRRSRKGDNVPRSRSDVDMDAAAEANRLHQSASSSASSLSTRSLENPTPPYTPKSGRRSMDSPNPLIYGVENFLQQHPDDDLGRLSDMELEPELHTWQQTVGRDILSQLEQREIDRQEVINELFLTESSHLRILRVLDQIFYQRMKKENFLSRDELTLLFPNLREVIEAHNSLLESMWTLREDSPVLKEIGDIMLARFDDIAGQEFQQVVANFCCNQSLSLEMIRQKQKRDQRFQIFMQDAESNPQCRRLQLKDLIVAEMQRLTKYPLLLENIMKYTPGHSTEHRKLLLSRDRCREILRYVNEAVKEAENRQRLEDYQKRLDTTPLDRIGGPLPMELKQLDLTTKRMIHEGPLTWQISKDKTIDIQVLLLEDLLVLLQKQDDRYLLKFHIKAVTANVKQALNPVLKLKSMLVRDVATDKRALFIINAEGELPQIYQLVAGTSLEKNTWKELLDTAIKHASGNKHSEVPYRNPEIRAHVTVATKVKLPPDPQHSPDISPQKKPPDPPPDDNHSDNVVASQLRHTDGQDDEVATPTQPGGFKEEELEGMASVFHYPAAYEKGVADSALEDVDILRRLILHNESLPVTSAEHRQLPNVSQEAEEEDITPTPSLPGAGEGAQVQGWTEQMDNQAKGWTSESQDHLNEEYVNSMHLESGDSALNIHLTEFVREGCCDGEHTDSTNFSTDNYPHDVGDAQSETQDKEILPVGTQPSFHQGSFKVVRKEGENSEVDDVMKALSNDTEARMESQALETAKEAYVDGNYFYLAMPTGPQESTTDCDSPTPAVQEEEPRSKDVLPLEMTIPSVPQSLMIRDVEEVFHTIEQLTLKLQRLKEIEIAHCNLLKSLGENRHERIAVSSPVTDAESVTALKPSNSPSLTRKPSSTSSSCEEGSSSGTAVRTPSLMLSTGF
ncbi:rho guanine nucleotide exchange factor 11 isoform X3 [Protopterus annectens]|uniref:rho guanine nucleotide exchange factor 11 isoform X3 n=1 Tax=Protopterus annectens TaxID=7888 RepID=UPI001CFA822A|nr:rho guanine nucleotide exchange factor 11 isoform X3 [Protopterus annectens]